MSTCQSEIGLDGILRTHVRLWLSREKQKTGCDPHEDDGEGQNH
jgi:hypothetical protein